MTDPRTHPVPNAQAHAAAVAEYRQDGYTVVSDSAERTELRYISGGSLVAHLVLFFTVGWLTLGVLNVWYAYRTRRKTADRVAIITQ